jgi:PleD family two-component response regulator
MSSLTSRLQQELARIKPASILIVEPDAAIAGLLNEHLSHYDTTVTNNGRDAYTFCQHTPPNLILIDLPDEAALPLFRQLLPIKFARHISIFLLGQSDDTREQRMIALEMGADDYISKPFDIIELQFRIKNALPNPAQSGDLVTGLPSWPAIHSDLQRRLKRRDWTFCLVHITYMGAYHDVYGTIAGQRARRAIANLLNDVVDELGELDDFIGALSENEFVIITSGEQHGRMLTLFQQRFQAASRQWYTPQELAVERVHLPNGSSAPLMAPLTAVVPGRTQTFSSTLEVVEAAETQRQTRHPAPPDPISPPLKAIFASS